MKTSANTILIYIRHFFSRRTFAFLSMLTVALSAIGQIADPVHFSSKLEMLGDNEAQIVFRANIDPGWHVYSTELGDDGPISATFNIVEMKGAETTGNLTHEGNELSRFDNMFGMVLRFFENNVTFIQKIRFTQPDYSIDCYLEYGACNDETCLPPSQIIFKKSGLSPVKTPSDTTTIAPVKKETTTTKSAENTLQAKDSIATAPQTAANSDNHLWEPVVDQLREYGDTDVNSSLFYIFLAGLAGGFLALLTPCVWPIIPMTVSFFLKRNKDRSKAIKEAVIYGISIVVIYVALGVLVTLLFGASALNALSTNAVFNIFFCLLLIVFAASFFGAFEITLPSSWSNKIDAKSENTSGLLSIFLMAFTLTLVSFSCTGPIIGFLLVAVSTQGSILSPTIGMLGFAIALALPFTLFALFPSLLKSAPKSGGWMNVVKVTLGFIELAFALKFLSVADLAYGWHLLDRETFLSLWIVLFALLGAYLLGWLKFPHDDPNHKTNVPQFFLALLSLSFAVYMIPGLWGAPLKAVSAFAPPMNTQDFNLYKSSVEARFHDYETGMAAAKAEGKPVIIDFTGYGCVNCRKMEAAVWTDANVADILNNKYVLISLYVDDKTPLPEPIEVDDNGQQRLLRTVGDKWSFLQRVKFGANTQPFYVLIDNEGKPLNASRSYDENIGDYIDFLQKGLDNYR